MDFVLERKLKFLTKQRLIRAWTTLCIVHHRATRLFTNMQKEITFKQRRLAQAMKARLIQRALRKQYQKFGADARERTERKIPLCAGFFGYTMNQVIEPRSKEILVAFLRQMMKA